jgi:hypothetical protein
MSLHAAATAVLLAPPPPVAAGLHGGSDPMASAAVTGPFYLKRATGRFAGSESGLEADVDGGPVLAQSQSIQCNMHNRADRGSSMGWGGGGTTAFF